MLFILFYCHFLHIYSFFLLHIVFHDLITLLFNLNNIFLSFQWYITSFYLLWGIFLICNLFTFPHSPYIQRLLMTFIIIIIIIIYYSYIFASIFSYLFINYFLSLFSCIVFILSFLFPQLFFSHFIYIY